MPATAKYKSAAPLEIKIMFSVLLDGPIVSSEVFVAADDDNKCTGPIIADNEILEFIQSSKNITDANSDDGNEMNNAAPCSDIIRNEEHHEKFAQLFSGTFQ
ncbi:hypothetical protein TNCV_1499001 [Trichonephila clavipes]|nr:hypothetical protein TNCV_1499001 [Trichonephila clavipes]